MENNSCGRKMGVVNSQNFARLYSSQDYEFDLQVA